MSPTFCYRKTVVTAFALLSICLLYINFAVAQPAIDSPVSINHPVEAHHSLHSPYDKTSMYWNYGGSTVISNDGVRLTPDGQDRRGWMWNEYPLESKNYEVELTFSLHSRGHFGGEGFCIWLLSPSEIDPSTAVYPDAILGPVFGLRDDFDGYGVCLDVYDNDNKRNNPAVFVLNQDKKADGKLIFDHDTDYENAMWKVLPNNFIASLLKESSKYSAFKCVADVRNSQQPSKLLFRVLHNVLHVYVEQGQSGYKYCFATKMERDTRDFHLALTAATGQVADNVDIVSISTRYLQDTDKEFADAQLERLSNSGNAQGGRFRGLLGLIINLTSVSLIGIVAFQLYTYHSLLTSRIDLVQICTQINSFVVPHYALHAFLAILLLFTGRWILFFLHLPPLAFKVYEYIKKRMMFTPATIGPTKGHASGKISVYMLLGLHLAYYSVMQLYLFVQTVL